AGPWWVAAFFLLQLRRLLHWVPDAGIQLFRAGPLDAPSGNIQLNWQWSDIRKTRFWKAHQTFFPACWSASWPGLSQFRSSPMRPADQSCAMAVAAIQKTLAANSLAFSRQDLAHPSLHLLRKFWFAVQ